MPSAERSCCATSNGAASEAPDRPAGGGDLVAPLMQMITGGWVAGAIGTAAELHLFDALAKRDRATGSAGDIAAAIDAHAPSVYRLMRFLSTIGLLRQSGEGENAATFTLTDMGRLLCGSETQGAQKKPTLRDAAIFFYSHHCQRPWEMGPHSVRTGQRAFDKMFGMDAWKWYETHPQDVAVFNNAMTALASSMHAAAVEAYDFGAIGAASGTGGSEARGGSGGAASATICDIGGGHGHLLAQILAKHRHLHGILYDLPHVVSGSREVFDRFHIADRAKAEPGSFLERVPAADAYVMSHILHDWDDEHCRTILKNCRKAVKPAAQGGGRVIILDAVLKGPNEPEFGKLLDLEMLLVPGGRERTEPEFRELLAQSGWKLTRVIPTKSSVSVVEATAL